MKWNDHSDYTGRHALLSPSGYTWLNMDDDSDDLFQRYLSSYSQLIGTTVHEFAASRIKRRDPRFKIKTHDKNTLLLYLLEKGIPESAIDIDYIFENLAYYVNDAIGYKMDPEVTLFYSKECFGTADSISFRNNELRIHDLKTGKTPAHFEQLEIYAALFCLEYGIKPSDISTELRIYQTGKVEILTPDVTVLAPIIDKIVYLNKRIIQIKGEGAI